MPKYIDADAFIGWARTRYCKDCDKRKGMKNGKMRFVYDIGSAPCRSCDVDDMVEDVDNFPAADVEDGKRAAWISVKERLPEENTKAIVITEDKQMLVASYTSFGWMYPCYGEEPTHWMPLPEPPEVEE